MTARYSSKAKSGGFIQSPTASAAASSSSIRNSVDSEVATFEDDDGAFDHQDAAGFIKLNALRLRLNKKRKKS